MLLTIKVGLAAAGMGPVSRLCPEARSVRLAKEVLIRAATEKSSEVGFDLQKQKLPWQTPVMPPANLFPYVVPEAYLNASEPTRKISRPLGHGLFVALVLDLKGMVQSVTEANLAEFRMDLDAAHQLGIQNLVATAKSGKVGMRVFNGPQNKPFALFGGHWLAATCILLPDLFSVLQKGIGSAEICISIPHRDALLAFGNRDASYIQEMKKMILEKESDGPKRLTDELFLMTESGISMI